MARIHRSERSQKLASSKGNCAGCGRPTFTAYCERCMPSATRSCYGKLTVVAAGRFDEAVDPDGGFGIMVERNRKRTGREDN